MKVTIHDPAGDSMKQFSMIEDLLGKKPDAVAMAPVEPESMVPLVERLAEAGIPSFACDLQLRSPELVCNVRNDPHAMGEAAGLYITDCAKDLGEPLTTYIIYGMLQMITQAPPRGQGFKDAVAATDLVTWIDGPDCGWVEPQACDAVMTSFAAHPEYNAIYEMGAMCGGVVEGLRAIDRLYPIGDPNHVVVICNDESKSVIEHIESGYVDGAVTHSAHKDIDTMFKAMLTHIILGQDVAKTIIVPSTVLSNKDIGTTEWLNSWGYLMLHEVPWDEWPIGEWGLISTPTPDMCK
jgi:ribose transport system substrate-binding protein